MTNKWNIPTWIEALVRERDTACVYCGTKFKNNPRNASSWEHINNNAKDIESWNIVLCCRSCNSSKGVRKLADWFKSKYCLDKNINKRTVAKIIKKYITEERK